MKNSILLMLAVLTAIFTVQAQGHNPFQPLKKTQTIQQKFGIRAVAIDSNNLVTGDILADSTPAKTNAWRPNIWGGYGYTAQGNQYAVLGTGFEYTNFKLVDNRYVAQWSAGAYVFGNGAVAPRSPTDVVSIGAVVSYKFITAGYAKSVRGGQDMFLIGTKFELFPAN